MIRNRLLAAVVSAALLCTGVSAEDPSSTPDTLDVWDDPTFQKQFLGSYGFQAEIEPRVTAVEQQQMQKILPLLSSDPDAALRQLQKVTKPESSAVFDFTLGNLYFQREELDTAAAHYRDALEKFPSFRRAHKNLGLILVRQGRFQEAIASLSRVVELGGGDGLTYGLLGYCYGATEQSIAAESAYRNAMLLQPETLDWKLGLTRSVLRQEKYEEAAKLCEELIEQYPDRADFWLLQANAYIGLGEPLRAAGNFEFLQRMGEATLASLNTLGDIYVNAGMYDLALRAYRAAIELGKDEEFERPLRNVEALAQRGALEQASALLGTVQERFDDQLDDAQRKDVLKLQARIQVAEGDGGEAVAVLEEIVALDPLDGEALLLLGRHYARNGDPERAIFYYERAASLDEFEADAKVRHAEVLVSQSKYREAVPLLKRAQELDPRDEVAKYLEQVERIARSRS